MVVGCVAMVAEVVWWVDSGRVERGRNDGDPFGG